MMKWFISFIFRVIFYDKMKEINSLERKNNELKRIYKMKKAHKMSFPKEHKIKRMRESAYLIKEIGEMIDLTQKTHQESMKEIKSEIRSEYMNLFTTVAQFAPHVAKYTSKKEKTASNFTDEILIEEIT